MYCENLVKELPPSRNLIKYKFYKRRKDFENKQNLSEKDASDSLCQINYIPDKIHAQKLVIAQAKTFSFQAVKGKCPKGVNTKYSIKRNQAVQTSIVQTQINSSDKENDRLLIFLESVVPDIEEALCSNETIDIFFDDLNFINKNVKEEQFELESSELAVIKELKSFEYESCKGKIVSCIRFRERQRDGLGLVAVSFRENLLFEEEIELQMRSHQSEVYLWNYEDFHRYYTFRITGYHNVKSISDSHFNYSNIQRYIFRSLTILFEVNVFIR